MNKTISYTYTRQNHLKYLLDQFNFDDNAIIPVEIYEKIKDDIKHRNLETNDLNLMKIRNIFKKYDYIKYIEHAPLILCNLTGITLPKMTKEDEQKITKIFGEICTSYNHCCPPDRSNFPSYNFILYKICKLLGMHDFSTFYYMSNMSVCKRLNYENIWTDLCVYNYNTWKKYPGYSMTESQKTR